MYLQLVMVFRVCLSIYSSSWTHGLLPIRCSEQPTLLVLEQIASSQRCLCSGAIGEGILVDGEVGGVMRRLRSAGLIVHAHEVVVGGWDHLGVECEVLATHQWLHDLHVLGANHFAGHIHEEIVKLRAVASWGEERVLVEEGHVSTASMHGCL